MLEMQRILLILTLAIVLIFTIYSLSRFSSSTSISTSESPSTSESTSIYTPLPTCPPTSIYTYSEPITCPWKFERYEASPYEKMWFDHREEWGKTPCSRYKLDENDKKSDIWYNYAKEHQMTPPTTPPDFSVFSNLVYKRTCSNTEIKIPIEPLCLAMRSPKFCADNGISVLDKSHIYPDWEMIQQRNDTNGKVYFFDMGSSSYTEGLGGASQSWFIEILEKRGFELDGIWAWEYKKYDPDVIFTALPQRLFPIYHWFNVGVNAEKGSGYNPWTILKKVATKDDMVIVKLDIDSPHIEISLAQQILDDPEISNLIDVFFYEDHINIDEMNPHFGAVSQTFKNSMELFTNLRKAGLRAHPWV